MSKSSRRILTITPLVFLFCVSVHAEGINERAVKVLVKDGISEADVRNYYNACDSGNTSTMMICAQYKYTIADLELNDSYKQVMRNIRGTAAESKLVKSQRAWLEFRDAACDYESDGWSGGTGYGMAFNACMQSLTDERTKQLKKYAQCKDPGCPGEW